ncbi:MAG: hypothetical protein ACOCUR_02465, partial [Nanoarchaeota archaeon]
ITRDKLSELDVESRVLIARFSGADAYDISGLRILEGTILSPSRLNDFIRNMAASRSFYDTIKARLNLKNEFCIYFEDDEGNLLYLHELIRDDATRELLLDDSLDFPEKVLVTGIGSRKINISGVPCMVALD